MIAAIRRCGHAAAAIALALTLVAGDAAATPVPDPMAGKRVIGATAGVKVLGANLVLHARVDTGATSCSIHADKVEVDGADKLMTRNIGKPARVLLRDAQGKEAWLDCQIADTVRVKTSDGNERRYKVWMTLRHAGIERRVHVTLNDRSKMEFPLLVGRNFLCGPFIVDVNVKHSPLGDPDPAAGTAEGDADSSDAD
ncbi:MAG: RimK/LysX family protein [Planctomycetota bacterium]